MRVVGRWREDETHGGCCIHVLHADLILTITVLGRTHQFHWLLAKVRCVSSFLDKRKRMGSASIFTIVLVIGSTD